MERYEKYGGNPSWIVKWYGNYRRKVSWIAIRYGQNSEMIWKIRKQVSWIVKRYEKYGGNPVE